MRHSSQQEIQRLQAQVVQLQEENKKITDEILRLRGAAASAPEAPSVGGADALWNAGIEALNKGQFDEALTSLQSFKTTYPKDPRHFGALLLVGMTHYKKDDFKASALEFNQAIDRAPKKGIGPSIAWYGQGAAFSKLGQAEDAKLFFEETVRRYPSSTAAASARQLLAKKAKVPDDLFKAFPRWPSYVR